MFPISNELIVVTASYSALALWKNTSCFYKKQAQIETKAFHFIITRRKRERDELSKLMKQIVQIKHKTIA